MTEFTGEGRRGKGNHGKPEEKGPKRFGGKREGGKPWQKRPDVGGRFARPAQDRQMYRATCSECGDDCEVPFKPFAGKPVFCRNCFRKDDSPEPRRNTYSSSKARPSDPYKAQFEQLNRKLDRIIEALESE